MSSQRFPPEFKDEAVRMALLLIAGTGRQLLKKSGVTMIEAGCCLTGCLMTV
jgi:transposase-like protein